mmetsp:Transcript_4514/g.15870  ORF Transcript_4514/g.15870 Transcript_4514/m.15870 type:complete len:335 (-) Transcript_4514:52-1056(-)
MAQGQQKARLSLAFRGLKAIPPRSIESMGPRIRELDLSHNQFQDLTSVGGFTRLETLVLDNNKVSSHTKIPRLPFLTTLWCNNNEITNMSIFVDKLVDAVPKLRYLSMLGNEACPNFLTGGSLKQYKDYRFYVINRLRNLCSLDSTPITEDERRQALRLYGSLPDKVAPHAATYEQMQEEERQRELDQREQEKEAAKKRREEIKKKRAKKLARQKKRREKERKKAEEAGKPEAAGEAAEGEEADPKAFVLPDLDELDTTAQGEGLPSVFMSLDPPIPDIEHLEALEELTDDEDWSSDEEEAGPVLAPLAARAIQLPAVQEFDEFTDEDDDDEWD